ncbi:uncharacterized protein LOC133188127 [Saccostrea echinata]|uniref:uncharacterized protein LOC133188127 n=1 Tax=Saccostrea echinata TaxID=191078 RepID=UPI002A8158DA|nr:uncharacterized protein LOC133188127 [Saccostrea echinata]
MINAIGVQKRTVEQVKFKWGNLQQGAKKSFSEARKQSKLTGGGPPPKPLTAAEEKIIEMMKDRPNFSGIVGGFESSVPAFAVVSKETESEAASTSTHGTNEERTEADIDVNEVQSSECTYPERTNAEKESEFECCSERDQSPSVTKPKKRKRITLDVLQTVQYKKMVQGCTKCAINSRFPAKQRSTNSFLQAIATGTLGMCKVEREKEEGRKKERERRQAAIGIVLTCKGDNMRRHNLSGMYLISTLDMDNDGSN